MASAESRYRQRSGTMDACKLPCEQTMPRADASPEAWEQYHSQRAGKGGFDPLSILKGSTP